MEDLDFAMRMPTMQDDGFVDAVRPALEALLSDLQHTTEVLKRANQSGRYSELRDIDPIYQEQTLRTNSQHGLDNLEQMLDDYSEKRRYFGASARERPTVHSLFNELDYDGSSYQIADLLLSCPDSDVIRSTIDFIMFVIKDETVREHLSKDCSLVESLRSLTAQMNENSASAQFLLFHLTAESEPMVSFAEIL